MNLYDFLLRQAFSLANLLCSLASHSLAVAGLSSSSNSNLSYLLAYLQYVIAALRLHL